MRLVGKPNVEAEVIPLEEECDRGAHPVSWKAADSGRSRSPASPISLLAGSPASQSMSRSGRRRRSSSAIARSRGACPGPIELLTKRSLLPDILDHLLATGRPGAPCADALRPEGTRGLSPHQWALNRAWPQGMAVACRECGRVLRGLVGVVAIGLLLVVSGCGQGGRHTIVLDESQPTYEGVGLGSSAREVERALGRGESGGGFAPVGRLPAEVDVPAALPTPAGAGREGPTLLVYSNAAFLLVRGRVFAMLLTDERLRTERGITIGAELGAVRRVYGGVKCHRAPAGESGATYPLCRVRVGRSRFLSFGGDPIRSFTFFSRVPVSAG